MFVLAGGESETLFIIELSDQTAFHLSFFGIITTSKKNPGQKGKDPIYSDPCCAFCIYLSS